jgi:hypothetical protein
MIPKVCNKEDRSIGGNMKQKIFCNLIVMSLIFVSLVFAAVSIADATEFGIEEVLNAIKQEIQTARQQDTGSPTLKIDKVEVELSVVTKKDAGGGIKVVVLGFTLGAESAAETTNSQKIQIALIPEGLTPVASTPELGLVAAIREVKSALRNTLNTPPPFKLDKLTFEIEFAVEKKADGKINFVIVDLTGARNVKATHKVKIEMSRKT